MSRLFRLVLVLLPLTLSMTAVSSVAHPLRLSLCEIDFKSQEQRMTIDLKLFLTDVNEALVFTTENDMLAFCQEDESPRAEPMLLEYLNRFFYVKVNGKPVALEIKSKKLSGDGENTALWVSFEYQQTQPLTKLEIKNAVFTDLFFDQNNIIYVHVDEESKSLMLNKKTPTHQLEF